MTTYRVTLENIRNGNVKHAIIVASDRYDASAIAEMKHAGYAAVDEQVIYRGSPAD